MGLLMEINPLLTDVFKLINLFPLWPCYLRDSLTVASQV